jgi:hypothetical protein
MDEQKAATYSAAGRTSGPRRSAAIVAAGAAALLLIGAAGFALAASPTPASPGASGAPAASPGTGARHADREPSAGAGLRGRLGDLLGPGRGFGAIHVTAIQGSSVSLATDDGWTRTITLGSSTKVMKAGAAISAGDLKVGDQVRIAETKAADGSYTIDRIQVVLPSVAGQVTAKSADSLTVKRLDGTTATIHVSSSTTYRAVGNRNASLADVNVGSYVLASGNARSDGSIDALQVLSGQPRAVEGRGRGLGLGPKAKDGQDGQNGATPAPSASTS